MEIFIYFPEHHSVMNTFTYFPKCYCGISSFSSFIRSQVHITKNEEDQILRKEFGIAYRNYCVQNNLPQASVIDFLGHLMQSGITRKAVEKDNNFYYVFCGVAWKKTESISYDTNLNVHGVESTSIAHSLSNYVPRHNGFDTFLRFCQSYVVFTMVEEHCVMQEEFETSYKKFCRRYGLKKASLADMKSSLVCTKVKCLDLKHVGGENCCVFFGMQLLKDGVTDNNKVEPTQVERASTPAFETCDAVSAVSKSEILELEEPSVRVSKPRRWVTGVRLENNVKYFRENSNYFITASDKQGIAKCDVTSETEGDSVALDIENDLEYLNYPYRKHVQEVVGKKENIALTCNCDETNKILKSDIKMKRTNVHY
ncbi:uncharacterized protein [Macrobrachium rosenbergii]|uniref:uncharacterized protein isoform X1 n=2 Tax=Macrobrachium rosenbergii TaxID=79674 RepID=UPI0034D49EB4